jgi:cell division protein FtsW (lipid II flippase)
MNKSKLFLCIAVILTVIFLFVYSDSEVQVTQVMTVILLTALLVSLGVNFVIQQIQKKKRWFR